MSTDVTTTTDEVTRELGLAGQKALDRLQGLDAKPLDQYTDDDFRALFEPRIDLDQVLGMSDTSANLVHLTRLSTFKPMQNQSAGQLSVLLETLSRDLGKWPQWAVVEAVERYRASPTQKWFPLDAKTIMQFVAREVRAWQETKALHGRLKEAVERAGGVERIRGQSQRRRSS